MGVRGRDVDVVELMLAEMLFGDSDHTHVSANGGHTITCSEGI